MKAEIADSVGKLGCDFGRPAWIPEPSAKGLLRTGFARLLPSSLRIAWKGVLSPGIFWA
jgi:hypothetical protein